jgi:hypothetical protein
MLKAPFPIGVLRALLHVPPRGVAIVEFALALPFLVLLLVGLGDLGLGFYQALQVQGAAAAGAEYATLHRWDVTKITTAVQNATNLSWSPDCPPPAGHISACPAPSQVCLCPDGGTLTPQACGTTCPSGSPVGLYASVSAQLPYSPVVPWPWLNQPLNLSGQAYRRLQ